MATQKEVKVKVATDVDMDRVEALEKKVNELKLQRLQMKINADTAALDATNQKLKEAEGKLAGLKNIPAHLGIKVDDEEITKAEQEVQNLKEQKIALEIAVETGKLEAAQAEVEELDGKEVTVGLNMATQNFSQGLSQAKQGVSELMDSIAEVQDAGMKSEQNKAFLTMNLGAEKAAQTYQQISDIVASMPGDDNTMRSVLSTAQALGNNLSADEMKAAAGTMADYMAGSATMGKMSLESQQDIMKYLLDGNTAELERGSIVSAYVDKLKDASTFQERQAAMQEVLNQLGYGGIAQQDTLLNKQAEWEGMIYNSSDALSSMWLNAEKGAMDYILQLNDATNGVLGMGIVAAQTLTGPVVDLMGGLAQVGMGFKTLKDAADWTGIADKLSSLKTSILDVATSIKGSLLSAWSSFTTYISATVIPAVKNAALALKEMAISVLETGYNALKSAAMWLAEKAAVVASTVAEYALAAAQAVLNVVMSMNPIMLVVIALVALAAALLWAYNNVDWFREMVDNAWQSLVQFGQYIYNLVSPALQWLGNLFQQFTSQLGLNTNDWLQAILGFILFIPTLPLQVGIALANTLAKALGFGNNFVQGLISAASNAVTGFANYIRQIPSIVMGEFNRVLGMVNDFINSLPSRVWDMGAAIIGALKSALGIGSPGFMFYMMEGELKRIEKLPESMEGDITRNVSLLGSGIVDSFNPDLGTINGSVANGSIGGTVINLYMSDFVVDDEDRVDELCNAIAKRLSWDNTTAGRTV